MSSCLLSHLLLHHLIVPVVAPVVAPVVPPVVPPVVAVMTMEGAVALVRKVKYFKGPCASRAKFHVSIGHTTVMATATFFGAAELYGHLPAATGVGACAVSAVCACVSVRIRTCADLCMWVSGRVRVREVCVWVYVVVGC